MGILMESIDFNECLKKKKELEKEAETTTPEEVKDEKEKNEGAGTIVPRFLSACSLWKSRKCGQAPF